MNERLFPCYFHPEVFNLSQCVSKTEETDSAMPSCVCLGQLTTTIPESICVFFFFLLNFIHKMCYRQYKKMYLN